MIKRTWILGSVLLSLVLFPSAAADAASAGTVSPMVTCSTSGVSSLSGATAVSRGKTWVDAHVPYSQTACHTDSHGTYREDCSGFISMAWGLNGSYVTSTLPSVATAISKSSLQPGDMLDLTSSHAVLFVGWYDGAHTRVNIYQEGSTSTGTRSYTNVPLSNYASYGAYRYNHITPTSVPNTGPIIGIASKCLDDYHSGTTNGNRIQLYTCNGGAAQHWTAGSDGTLRVLGKCLDDYHSGTANGNRIQLYACNGTAAQHWTAASDGSLRVLGKCLDVYHSGTADGNTVQLYQCNATAAQQWRLP